MSRVESRPPSSSSRVKSLLTKLSSIKKDPRLSSDQKHQAEELASDALRSIAKDVEVKYKQSPSSVTSGERDAYEMIERRPLSSRLRVEHVQDKHGLTNTYRAAPETRAFVSQVVQPALAKKILVDRFHDDSVQPEREALRGSLFDPKRRQNIDTCVKELCASCQGQIGLDMIRIMLDMFKVEMYERWLDVQQYVRQGLLTEDDALHLYTFMMTRMREVVKWLQQTPSDKVLKSWTPFTHLLFRYVIDIVNEISYAVWTAKQILRKEDLPSRYVETVDEMLGDDDTKSGDILGRQKPGIFKIIRMD